MIAENCKLNVEIAIHIIKIQSLQLENDADTGLAGYLISEEYIIGDMDTDKSAQNEFITQQITNENILDFSEKNPFGDAGA